MCSRHALLLLAAGMVAAASVQGAGLRFVREGLVVDGAAPERPGEFRVNGAAVQSVRLPGGAAWLLEAPWAPRAETRVEWPGGSATATAPLRPAPWVRWSKEWPSAPWLDTAAADEATALAISPGSERLAAGSQQGRLAVFSLTDGATQWSLQRAGRVIKQVVFDSEGQRLYVGEQGAEGRLAAYDLAQPGTDALWVLDAAGDLGSGPTADPADPYAWVTQPGAYRMAALGGDLLAAMSRSWNEGGRRQARSRLYRIDGATGALRWAWPAEGAQAGLLTWFALDAPGGRLAVPVQTPMGASSEDVRPSEIVVLDLATGRPVARVALEPVPPYPVAALWRGLGLQAGGGGVAVTSDDGRAFLWRQDGGTLRSTARLRLVEPVRVGGITVTATNGALATTAAGPIFATGPTYVPPEFGGGGEPTLDHPRGNTLYAHDWAGRPRWVWRMDNDLQGLASDRAGHWLAVAEGAERAQTAARFHGVALLDLRADDAERAVFRWPLEGRPVYGALDLSADGHWLAVAEAPRKIAGEARPHGAARLHLVR